MMYKFITLIQISTRFLSRIKESSELNKLDMPLKEIRHLSVALKDVAYFFFFFFNCIKQLFH